MKFTSPPWCLLLSLPHTHSAAMPRLLQLLSLPLFSPGTLSPLWPPIVTAAHPKCHPANTSFLIPKPKEKEPTSHWWTNRLPPHIAAQVSHNHPFHHILTRRERKNRNCPIDTHHPHTRHPGWPRMKPVFILGQQFNVIPEDTFPPNSSIGNGCLCTS